MGGVDRKEEDGPMVDEAAAGGSREELRLL